ncbi:glucodextranase DOMON-like domain-containing protein [uncultured Maribacter sp.]
MLLICRFDLRYKKKFRQNGTNPYSRPAKFSLHYLQIYIVWHHF